VKSLSILSFAVYQFEQLVTFSSISGLSRNIWQSQRCCDSFGKLFIEELSWLFYG